jgi:hypothetical protein
MKGSFGTDKGRAGDCDTGFICLDGLMFEH